MFLGKALAAAVHSSHSCIGICICFVFTVKSVILSVYEFVYESVSESVSELELESRIFESLFQRRMLKAP